MQTTCVSIALTIAACGGGQQLSHSPDSRGWAEHIEDADRHDRAADSHERAAAASDLTEGGARYTCGDTVLNDQLTTGGIRVTSWQPCFDVAEENSLRQREQAVRERELARAERRTAGALVRAELRACDRIPPRERDHSPFAHRKAIASVIAHRESGQVRGAWVIFKPVPGLNADWLRRDLACQRARWAVQGPPPGASSDPLLVPGATAEVYDRGDHAEVLITTATTETGELALARAEGWTLAGPEALAGREHEVPEPEHRR